MRSLRHTNMEIPFDLVRKVQISLRRHANLPSYDTDDASFGDLPSAEEATAALDPSPHYLRCRHCKGRLLRGLQSSICVFCGRDACNDVAPDPINFRNTLGYRWLLESLNLDGSEIVAPSVEANNTHRGRTAPKGELPLSDLLDLEIKWPSELDKFGSCLSKEKPVQSKSFVNISGVNVEKFFASEEKDAASNASIEPSGPVNQIYTKETIEVHNSLDLFENAQPFKPAAPSSEEESNYSDSGWGAPCGTTNAESTSFDPFVGSADLSAHMDEVFGPAKDSSSDTKVGVASGSVSVASDWFSDDPWNNSNLALPGSSHEIKRTERVNTGSVVENVKYSSSTVVDWAQDGIWQKSNSKKDPDSAMNEGDDSFDDWNDFASSTTAQDPSVKQTTTPDGDKTSEINLFSSANQSQDIIIFDSFSQPDLFSGEFSSPNVSTGNKIPHEASISDRAADASTKIGGDSEDAERGGDVSGAETTSKADDVKMILSQMHDLSFMLESNPSIPHKQEGVNSISRD